MRLPAPLRRFLAESEDEVYFLIRLLIFTVNVIAWIFSIFFICIGIWILQEKNNLGVDNLSSDPAAVLIAIGTILFLITFTGCIGTLRENLFLLKVYLGMIVVLFIIEIVTGLVAFLYANKVMVTTVQSIMEYHDDPDSKFLMDELQKKFECCGAYSFNDWEHNAYFQCSSEDVLACGVPFSCCITVGKNSQCGFGIRKKDEIEAKHVVYTDGCITKLKWWINDYLHIIGALGFAFACVQLFLILIVNKLIMDLEEISKTTGHKNELTNSNEITSGV
ncbi:tetraspanin-33-like [Dendronephthya gigantea]|uniref:tetraspanin-33-like n=1 Tax=Dendronephthya gigantea TaxID=151771 RepID=UPI00106D88C3|nr:tetraspanin-33-like [Dendronephthya gigantea]